MSKRNSTSPAALYLRDRKNNPAPVVKFTHAKIEALPIPTIDEGEYEVRIEGKVGLRCRVRPSGVKSFAVVAKHADSSRTMRIGLGKFGRVPLTIREAADEQRQLRQKHTIPSIEGDYNNTITKVDSGEDLRKKTSRQTHGYSLRGGDPIPTLKRAYDDYMKEGDLASNTEKSYQTAINHLESWWDLRITDITPRMVLARHKELTDKTLVDAPKGPGGGRRLRGGPVWRTLQFGSYRPYTVL